jgi:hypothetical protein
MKVIIVGSNVRNVAESAIKAGYKVFALTKFLDADLMLYVEKAERIKSREWARGRTKELAEEQKAGVVLTTGFEDLDVNTEVWGCNPKEAAKVVDKLKFYRTLEKAGIRFPELLSPEDEDKIIVKPRKGGGGEKISLCKDFKSIPQNFISQRYIEGIPCSVSLIAGRKIYVIAINRILSGWKEMNADGFRYAGNVTPLTIDTELRKELIKIATETAELFDLVGSIGVDFILADKPYVLEINPRFQGSLDSIEWSCDINLFKLHMLSIEGKSIEVSKPNRFAARAILFADKRIEINTSPVGNPFFADVPCRGNVHEKRNPLVSILATGLSEGELFKKIVERRDMFMEMQKSVNRRLSSKLQKTSNIMN